MDHKKVFAILFWKEVQIPNFAYIEYFKLKGHRQVRYCNHFASIIVCKLLQFNLFPWNQWTNWNQIW